MPPLPISRRAVLAAAGASLAVAAMPARAQAWPERPLTLVVPNAAGGAADNLARSFAEELGKQLRQSVIVENLGGASGALAAQKVLRAAPDGYTLLFGTTSDMVVTPIAVRSAGYSPRDFTSIVKVGVTPMSLVARPQLGISSAEQLAELARRKPKGVSVGVTGNASLQAFATVAIEKAGRFDLLAVPYKGGAPMLTDLMGGTLDLGVSTLPGVLGHVRSGKLVMLGVLSDKRAAAAPDLPTLGESPSFRGVSIEIWAALAGPPRLPAAIVERISQAARAVLEDKDYVERRARNGDVTPPFMSPAEMTQFVAAEDARYRALATGLTLE